MKCQCSAASSVGPCAIADRDGRECRDEGRQCADEKFCAARGSALVNLFIILHHFTMNIFPSTTLLGQLPRISGSVIRSSRLFEDLSDAFRMLLGESLNSNRGKRTAKSLPNRKLKVL